MNKTIFISWENHRRSSTISKKLEIDYLYPSIKLNSVFKYPLYSIWTLYLLVRKMPRTVIAQNPSFVLCFMLVFLKRLFRFRLFVDAHNEAVTPYINTQRWVKLISRYIIAKADYTIVTNLPLSEKVRMHGGSPIVFPDLLPENVPDSGDSAFAGANETFKVFLVCTYAEDEPYMDVIMACERTKVPVELLISGSPPQKPLAESLRSNVICTGFLAETDYWATLKDADLVIDLTDMPDCLVCGAYETVSVGTLLLLTNGMASEFQFSNVAEFTDNDADSIQRSIEWIFSNFEQMSAELPAQKNNYLAIENLNFKDFLKYFDKY